MASTNLDARADDLYQALDGLTLNGSWRVQVTSVVADNRYRWIQLELVGFERYALLFRLEPSASAADVSRALQWWLAGDRDGIDAAIGAIWNGIVPMHMVVQSARAAHQVFRGPVEGAAEPLPRSRRM